MKSLLCNPFIQTNSQVLFIMIMRHDHVHWIAIALILIVWHNYIANAPSFKKCYYKYYISLYSKDNFPYGTTTFPLIFTKRDISLR